MTRDQRDCLRQILASPEDDSARLRYADACEEAGDGARGEFIRTAIQYPWADFAYMTSRHPLRLLGLPGEDWSWAESEHGLCIIGGARGEGLRYFCDRGFVSEVRCTCEDWLSHGPAVVAAQPVTKVMLDRKPVRSGYGWTWWNSYWTQADDPEDLDENLFDALDGFGLCDPDDDKAWKSYVTEQEADVALSHAALAWARAEAERRGLMP